MKMFSKLPMNWNQLVLKTALVFAFGIFALNSAHASFPEARCRYNGRYANEVITLTVLQEGWVKNLIYQNSRTGDVFRSEILNEPGVASLQSYQGFLSVPPWMAGTKFDLEVRKDGSRTAVWRITPPRGRTLSITMTCDPI